MSLALKVSRFVSSRRLSGKSFHIQGAVTLNEHSANVFFLTNGTTSLLELFMDDLRFLFGFGNWIKRSVRYMGALQFVLRHLKTMVASLYLILCLIGSQCSLNIAVVALANLGRFSMTLAARFWVIWSLSIVTAGNPLYRLLL